MIKPSKLAVAISIKRNVAADASFGTLDVLPLELLHWIVSMLDLQTLSRLTRTCSRGVAVVASLPEYRDLLRHAPLALAALGSTKLLCDFAAHTIHTTLRSVACSSCGDFGPFLFLPTCQRCCYECLPRNQSLWVVSRSEAQKAFGLPAADIKRLPTLHSVPGKYYVKYTISSKRRHRLVSVRAAKELAIAHGKSAEHLARALQDQRAAGLSPKKYRTLRWISTAALQAPGEEILSRPSEANVPNDRFCGMASVPFLALPTNGGVERGLWCLGCEEVSRDFQPNRPNEALSHLVAPGIDVTAKLFTMQHVARSEHDFLKHSADCPGTKAMIPDLEAQLQLVV